MFKFRRPCWALWLISLTAAGILAAPAQATFPGPNGRIAFSRFSYDPVLGFYAWAIWAANPDGSHQVRLTHMPNGAFVTDWSPDGHRIVFDFPDADGNQQIATINADGTAMAQLTSGGFISEAASFSPDGSHIIYAYVPADTPGWHESIWVMDADGTHQHVLTPDTAATFDGEPKFSPDGRFVAFTRLRKSMGNDDRNQQNAVFVMRANGTELRQLTPWGQAAEHPDWSPDGRWIAFNDKLASTAGSETIYLMRPDGSDTHVLYQAEGNGDVYKPHFSPDGTKVLFGCQTSKHKSTDGDIAR